ncbi:MAG: hypothetical protein VXY02_04620 [Pseudomonadota bacterium]|nr:hypothetical protein [Pseudomonadota bacterium]MEC7138340.1 hypothetical protein [Pseudomonadota bacterium]MEC7380133.1 hypothetical protein [Pseudomonadota bacterium]MEC7414064.1 hypothetical protein [Pseudomonadota bacterium]MEC7419884.1 hypothetical protein [Pseudomonadota bacterium]
MIAVRFLWDCAAWVGVHLFVAANAVNTPWVKATRLHWGEPM